jgi:hypothetical protein
MSPATTRSKQEAVDLLSDALDEFESGNGDVSGLAADVDSLIGELEPASDPTWISGLREQSAILASAREQAKRGNVSKSFDPTHHEIVAAGARLRELAQMP